jgi:hypothetical protein
VHCGALLTSEKYPVLQMPHILAPPDIVSDTKVPAGQLDSTVVDNTRTPTCSVLF